MNLSSMTGFARGNGIYVLDGLSYDWGWELKSVNGKSLDLKTKLPSSWEGLSAEIKNTISRYICRGNVSISLSLQSGAGENTVKLNRVLLDELAQQAIMLYQQHPEAIQKPTAGELLGLKGVVESSETSLDEKQAAELSGELLKGLEMVCRKLLADRQAEGAKIKLVLENILEQMTTIVDKISLFATSLPDLMKTKLEQQLKQWIESAGITEERLAQEAVLYVTRADIREEVDRLQAHLKTAAQLLNSDEAVGRRLDFLCQELNREANTTCSKSCDIGLTNMGMNLKALIEQFREQVQNIE